MSPELINLKTLVRRQWGEGEGGGVEGRGEEGEGGGVEGRGEEGEM